MCLCLPSSFLLISVLIHLRLLYKGLFLSGFWEGLFPFKWNEDKARHLSPLWVQPVILHVREVLFEALTSILVVQYVADYF